MLRQKKVPWVSRRNEEKRGPRQQRALDHVPATRWREEAWKSDAGKKKKSRGVGGGRGPWGSGRRCGRRSLAISRVSGTPDETTEGSIPQPESTPPWTTILVGMEMRKEWNARRNAKRVVYYFICSSKQPILYCISLTCGVVVVLLRQSLEREESEMYDGRVETMDVG